MVRCFFLLYAKAIFTIDEFMASYKSDALMWEEKHSHQVFGSVDDEGRLASHTLLFYSSENMMSKKYRSVIQIISFQLYVHLKSQLALAIQFCDFLN